MSDVVAYWTWDGPIVGGGPGRLLCVPCWQRAGVAGQVQTAADVVPGERCASCGAAVGGGA